MLLCDAFALSASACPYQLAGSMAKSASLTSFPCFPCFPLFPCFPCFPCFSCFPPFPSFPSPRSVLFFPFPLFVPFILFFPRLTCFLEFEVELDFRLSLLAVIWDGPFTQPCKGPLDPETPHSPRLLSSLQMSPCIAPGSQGADHVQQLTSVAIPKAPERHTGAPRLALATGQLLDNWLTHAGRQEGNHRVSARSLCPEQRSSHIYRITPDSEHSCSPFSLATAYIEIHSLLNTLRSPLCAVLSRWGHPQCPKSSLRY